MQSTESIGSVSIQNLDSTQSPPAPAPGLLDGIRVPKHGQILAGLFASTILAYFGAEVIKVERPGAGESEDVDGIDGAGRARESTFT